MGKTFLESQSQRTNFGTNQNTNFPTIHMRNMFGVYLSHLVKTILLDHFLLSVILLKTPLPTSVSYLIYIVPSTSQDT